MLKKIFLGLSLLSFAVTASAQTEGLAPKDVADYNAVARLDAYGTDQLWNEFFTLPSGVSAYDNNDFADKGITFTYENSNPDLLTVTNCGYDSNKSYRRNNVTWSLKPLTAGEATLTIHCNYNGVTTTATRRFIVTEPADNPFTPNVRNVNGLTGLRDDKQKTVTIYFTNFFNSPAGWNDPSLWEANGISWGFDCDNTALISNIETTLSGTYAQGILTVEPVTGKATLTAWTERNGVRVESPYEIDLYKVRANDDNASLLLTPGTYTLDVFTNDRKTGTPPCTIISQPEHGTVSQSTFTDNYGAEKPCLVYTLDSVEGIANWSKDSFAYRLTDGDEHSDATVEITLRHNPTVAKIWEFVPAPGQFVNTASFKSADNLIGSGDTGGTSTIPSTTGLVSLGGFGGYVVVGFDQPVVNDPRNPYGVDFTISGNAFEAGVKGYWSEPGAVMVMRDDNGNGLPDDTWYELAGSNYWFKTSRRDITFTYEDPGYASRYYIPYTASDGFNGCVPSNQFHQQSYFPDPSIYTDVHLTDGNKLSLSGTHINAVYDLRAPSYIECYRPLAFGYCDNHATTGDLTKARNPYFEDENGKVTDGFDIDWAVDSNGEYVYLDHIDFIKVYNSVNQQCGWLGESSTEVGAIVITEPDPTQEKPGDYYINYAGITQLQVVEGKTCLYEGFAFHNGKRMEGTTARWSVEDESIGTIDSNGLFTALKTGATKIHFSATDLAPDDVFEVEVVTLTGVQIAREGNATTVSNAEGTALVGEKHFYSTVSLTTNGSSINGTGANHFIYDTYSWTSSDPEVARIDKGGFFETLKAGQTTLTATSDTDPSLSTTFNLTVLDLPEVNRYNNYLVVEDGRLSQEELNATTFSNDQIFIAKLVDGRATYKKRVDLALVKVEPEGYDDMFYIENNRLCNRLVKGDWREYRLTVEGTLGDITTTLTLPVLHTSANSTVAAPTIDETKKIVIDTNTRSGSLDLADVFVINGSPELYTATYRLATGSSVPEGLTASIADGIITVTLDDEAELSNGAAIEVEGQIRRATQLHKAADITPEAPTYHKVSIPVTMTSGIKNAAAPSSLTIYPNPAVYSFTLGNSEPVAVTLWSAAGARVFAGTVAPGQAVDVSTLPAGLYFVVLEDGTTLKLIKK